MSRGSLHPTAGRLGDVETPEPTLRIDIAGHDLARARPLNQRVLTAHVMLCEATSEETSHLPAALRRDLLQALGPLGRDAYRVIGGARATFRPSAAVPDCSGSHWATHARSAVADASVDQLTRELRETLGPDPTWRSRWRRVLDDPQAWLAAISAGLFVTAPIVERFYAQLVRSVDDERRRLDVVWQSAAQLGRALNGVSDHLTTVADEVLVAARCGVAVSVPGDLLVAPVLAPAPVRVLVDRGEDLVVMYSVASRVGVGSRVTPRQAAEPLNALLGPARAAVLLAVTRPRTMGQLAAELNYAPSTLTHHVQKLVAAGLVLSQRSRKAVLIERTLAGHVVVDLLAGRS